MVLRDSAGLIVDSLNYGGLPDLWAAKGDQAASGPHEGGCFVTSPQPSQGFGSAPTAAAINRSAGRFPDGADTDSNCTDFLVLPATTLPTGATAGSSTIKVADVSGFHAGEEVMVGTGTESEVVAISHVGTAGATTAAKDTRAGETLIPVADVSGFEPGATITIGSGGDAETVTLAPGRRRNDTTITITSPLQRIHHAGDQVSGTGLTLASALSRAHVSGSQVAGNSPTPGAPNRSAPN